jgi:hypothetical protein
MFVCFRKRNHTAGTGNGTRKLVPSQRRNEPWSNIALPPFKDSLISDSEMAVTGYSDYKAPPPPWRPACRPGAGGIPGPAPPTSSQAMWGLVAQLSPPGFPPCNLRLAPPGPPCCSSPHPVLLLAPTRRITLARLGALTAPPARGGAVPAPRHGAGAKEGRGDARKVGVKPW